VIEAQVRKVELVMEQHSERPISDYTDDAVYRGIVAESLDHVAMAEAALALWLENKEEHVEFIEGDDLQECQRQYESFLQRRYSSASAGEKRQAALKLCRAKNLLRRCGASGGDSIAPSLQQLAAKGGSFCAEQIKLLIAAGADVDACDAKGRSAMYFAAQQGHYEAIRALAAAGARCDLADSTGRTPLHEASLNCHSNCVQALLGLSPPADVNTTSSDHGDTGITPLYIACQQGHCAVVLQLLGARANVDQAAPKAYTPLCIASQFGKADVVNELVGAKADVNKAMWDGETALFNASDSGQEECVRALLRARADPTLANANSAGLTPLDIARSQGHASVVRMLQAALASRPQAVSAGKRARRGDGAA